MKVTLVRLGLAALVIGTLASCGGGGGGGDSGTGTAAAGAAAGGPAGTAVISAAAANPAATNTAQNPNQAFGLIAATGATPVVVQSPPVVYFTVIDSTGKFVPGLTLVNPAGSAAGLAADPNCSGNNVTFAIAKFDGTNWQNLISRQRYATADTTTKRYAASDTAKIYPPTYRYAVAEGTTDPKPTATTASPAFVNPATAVSDPSTRIVGILEEAAADGYYTYRFATDVTTPLLMANAVDAKNVALGKVANNGNVAVKDGKTIHRVGAQLCYTDPATKEKVVVNPYIDFTLGADGMAVPVKAADGKTLTEARKVVDKASCNECHSKLAIHGGNRVDPNYCVMCHNAGSTDFNTNNLIDFKYMIHKFHMGKKLTKDFQVVRNVAKGTLADAAATKIGYTYPQAQQNCVKCHDGSASATHKTAQGDNWKNVPSRNACGACHDGIDFATGSGTTLGGATTGHIGGAKKDDTQCVLCHDSTTIPVYHSDTTPSTADAAKRTMIAEITGVSIDVVPTAATAATTAGSTGTGNVTVTFTLTDNGVPVTSATAFSGLALSLAKLNPATAGASTYWQSYTGRARTKDAAKPPVIQGYTESALAANLTHVGAGVWTYKFQLLNGSTPGDIRTIDHAHNATASSITGAYSAATMPVLPNVTLPDTSMTTVSYDWWKTHRVGMEFNQGSGATAVNNKFNAIYDFVPLADSARKAETRNIVSMNTCATCHGGTKLHKGYTVEYCVTCHNRNTFDPYSGDTTTGLGTETVDLQRFVHKLHRGKDLPSVVAGGSYAINQVDYSYGAFPGIITDCAICHSATATKADGKTVLENAANWYTTPTKRACGTCHDSSAALSHIDGQITASGEQCTFCHGSTTKFGLDVKSVHK